MDNDKNLETYRLSKELWIYEGNLLWSKFNNFILINTIFLSAIIVSEINKLSFFLSILLPLFGIVLCFIGDFLVARSFEMHNYWINKIKLGKSRNNEAIEAIQQCGKFIEGIGDNDELKMISTGRFYRTRTICYFIIFIFLIIYSSILYEKIENLYLLLPFAILIFLHIYFFLWIPRPQK